MDKIYTIKFTRNCEDFDINHRFYREDLIPYFKKYNNKQIKLSDIPKLIKEVDEEVILTEDGFCEVYNDFREGGCK